MPEKLYPWLGVVSGSLIVFMGLALFIGRLRSSGLLMDGLSWFNRLTANALSGREVAVATSVASLPLAFSNPSSRTPVHAHADHHHGNPEIHAPAVASASSPHSHGFGLTHDPGVPTASSESVTWRRLIGLGIFGGLLPCPSAIVVMLGAITLHRVVFGLFLILFFSMGLAAVLTAIGFALVYGGRITSRIPFLRLLTDRAATRSGAVALALRAFPVGSAGAVLAAGLLITVRALAQEGLL